MLNPQSCLPLSSCLGKTTEAIQLEVKCEHTSFPRLKDKMETKMIELQHLKCSKRSVIYFWMLPENFTWNFKLPLNHSRAFCSWHSAGRCRITKPQRDELRETHHVTQDHLPELLLPQEDTVMFTELSVTLNIEHTHMCTCTTHKRAFSAISKS